MEQQQPLDNYSEHSTSTPKSNAAPYKLPHSTIGFMKRELIYIFFFETLGTLSLTFAIYASKYFTPSQNNLLISNNPFVIASVYGILLMLAQNQKCTFNPAITLILGLKEKATWISVAIFSQFLGAILGGLIGYMCFANEIQDAAYLYALRGNALFGDSFGEILGSFVLTLGIIFQYDELLDFTNNRLEHSIIIGSLFAFARTLTYKSQSILNPAVALSLEFFESCKDGQWSRFEFIWIFTLGPIVGALLAELFIKILYKPAFEKQIKLELKF